MDYLTSANKLSRVGDKASKAQRHSQVRSSCLLRKNVEHRHYRQYNLPSYLKTLVGVPRRTRLLDLGVP